MKTTKVMFAVAIMALMFASCGKKEKILVLYYSQTGNTKAVAEEFANRLGADIEEITAIVPYDGDFQATIERCKEEMALDSLPDINCLKHNINEYDVFFIGYPVWFGTYAQPIASFLRDNNLSGKKIVPFCTFGSGGLESSKKDLVDAQPDAWILPAYGIRAARMDFMPQEVETFLIANGFIKGKYLYPVTFSYPHPVSDADIALYDAAVKGYPMLNARPVEVGFRSNNGDLEYVYTAVDEPRMPAPDDGDKKPDLPPAGKVKVYVKVIPGVDTSFTRVVR